MLYHLWLSIYMHAHVLHFIYTLEYFQMMLMAGWREVNVLQHTCTLVWINVYKRYVYAYMHACICVYIFFIIMECVVFDNLLICVDWSSRSLVMCYVLSQSSVETTFLPLPFPSNILVVIVQFLYSDEAVALKGKY